MGKAVLRTIVFITFFISSFQLSAQTGKIVRVAGLSASNAILDPVAVPPAGYTSKSTSGFAGNDVTNAKLPFKPLPSFYNEPFGDLSRGPSHLYSDFVPDANGSGVYVYYDGTNLLFRMRLGSLVPGAKGYSILIDTDGKFGATGANADPNFQPATTGVNGNPGFEIEVDLFTNNSTSTGLAIYNVDGLSQTGTATKTYTNWQNYSQTSIAGTNDNGDPDFFLDFFIPLSDLSTLGVTASTQLRMSATTVMAPQAAIGGPKSDIYGLNDAAYKNTNTEYEAYINAQPSFTATSLNNTTPTTLGPICTAAPTVNSPISTGTVSISGTWTKSSLSDSTKATITVFKNGISIGTIANVNTGTTWTLSNIVIAKDDVITAKAKAAGESECLISNSVKASACNSLNKPATPILSCSAPYNKGLTGTNYTTGWTLNVENQTRNTNETFTGVNNTSFSSTTGTSPNITWNYSGGCSSGQNMASGSYRVYYTDANNCPSEPILFCLSTSTGNSNTLAGTSATPVITSPSTLTEGTSTIYGTGEANSKVRIYVDGFLTQDVMATAAGTFTFSGLSLVNGQKVYITNTLNTGTVSTSKCYAQSLTYPVTCYTRTPSITTNSAGELTAGSAITGYSGDPAGTTIKVYNSANTLVSTTSVASNGTWTTGSYTAVAGTSYYANATNGTCSVSSNTGNVATPSSITSSTRCGSINGGLTSSSTAVSGTIAGSSTSPIAVNTIVNVYEDGTKIGAYTFATSSTSSTAAWSISVEAGTLYNTGVITIGIKEAGTAGEFLCPATMKVSCTGPLVPTYTQKSSNGTTGNTATVPNGGTMTYTVSNLQQNTFYSVADATTGSPYASGIWTDGTATASSTINITTYSLTSGTYNGVLKATAIGTTDQCTSLATASTFIVLPVTLIEFKGVKKESGNLLTWRTAEEINSLRFDVEKSIDGVNYKVIGYRSANGTNSSYSFVDNNVGTVNYYRLRMVDNDGKYAYSKIILISDNGSSVVLNTVRPNPFVDEVIVSVYLTQAQQLQIVLTDAAGRQVAVKELNGTVGLNNINLNHLSRLTEGMYVLKVNGNGVGLQQKLIKIKN